MHVFSTLGVDGGGVMGSGHLRMGKEEMVYKNFDLIELFSLL